MAQFKCILLSSGDVLCDFAARFTAELKTCYWSMSITF